MSDHPRVSHPGGDDGPEERWRGIWSHREHLLKVARRRSMSAEDAEDAVQEAILRALEDPRVEDDRLGAWLTTVTVRLCVDRYRQVVREAELHRRRALASPDPVPADEAVCDRAEAGWLVGRSGELPARQAEALRLKSQDLGVGQIARRMGLSYQAVESLLARARRTLRNRLSGMLSLLLTVCVWRKRPGPGPGPGVVRTATTTTAAATLAVAGLVLPPGSSYRPDDPHPPRATVPRTAEPATARPDRQRARTSTGPGAFPYRRADAGAVMPHGDSPVAARRGPAPPLTFSAPQGPTLSLSPAALPVPHVPQVPVRSAIRPAVSASSLPEVPVRSGTRAVTAVPAAPSDGLSLPTDQLPD